MRGLLRPGLFPLLPLLTVLRILALVSTGTSNPFCYPSTTRSGSGERVRVACCLFRGLGREQESAGHALTLGTCYSIRSATSAVPPAVARGALGDTSPWR